MGTHLPCNPNKFEVCSLTLLLKALHPIRRTQMEKTL